MIIAGPLMKFGTETISPYIGGIDDQINEAVLRAAFIPFGDILDVQIPRDPATSRRSRCQIDSLLIFRIGRGSGYGFVEFETSEDAAASIDNMNQAEICGRVVRCSVAKPMRQKEWTIKPGMAPVWVGVAF